MMSCLASARPRTAQDCGMTRNRTLNGAVIARA
jgi:hypothetical protein